MTAVLESQPRETSQWVALQASQYSFDIDGFLGVQGHGVNIVVTSAVVDHAGINGGGSQRKNWSIFYAHSKSRTVCLLKSDLRF